MRTTGATLPKSLTQMAMNQIMGLICLWQNPLNSTQNVVDHVVRQNIFSPRVACELIFL